MSDNLEVQAVKIGYIHRDVKSLNKKFDDFVINQDKRFCEMGVTFVRADVLEKTLLNFNNTLTNLNNQQVLLTNQMKAHDEFLPMIKDIKAERDSIKFKIMSLAGKVLFWACIAGLGVEALAK